MSTFDDTAENSPASRAFQGTGDPILDGMIEDGMPLTLGVYLDLAYPGRDFDEEPLGGEEEAMIPDVLLPDR